SMFRALKYRNFQLFFPGLACSQIGIWIQNVAMSWLVYDMTKSPLLMGIITCLNTIPLFILTPFGGVIADKFDRKKLLITVQILFALQALLLTVTVMADWVQIWNIVVLGVFLNSIAAIDAPLRQSLFVLVVDDPKDLGNAISLNASCFNIARLVGPAMAGILIANFGIKFCFLVTFLCLVPAIFLVSLMNITDVKSEKIKNETFFEGFKEGIEYSVKTPQISTLLMFLATFSFIAMTYPMLMPIYTTEVLLSNADILGFLMSSTGIGALISALLIASKTTIYRMRTILCIGCTIFALGFITMGLIHSKTVALISMFVVGLGTAAFLTPLNTLMQNFVDDDKRGRVMSLNAICFMGTTSISSLIAGSIAEKIGISNTFVLMGLVLITSCAFFAFKLSKLTYVQKTK
ncbi:MFS transporter, partial [bacterium]|nr:MFS transporter [bacterium]